MAAQDDALHSVALSRVAARAEDRRRRGDNSGIPDCYLSWATWDAVVGALSTLKVVVPPADLTNLRQALGFAKFGYGGVRRRARAL